MFAAASASIALGTALIVAMDWIPTPLNRNIVGQSARERLPSTFIHGTIGAVLATLCAMHVWLAALIGAVWYAAVLFVAIRNWWVPYFAARYPGEITPKIFAREYASNLSVLRPFRGNPVVPDLQHTLIHAGLTVASLLSLAAALSG